MMYSNQLNTDWLSVRTPALVFTNSLVFTNEPSLHPHLPQALRLLSSSSPFEQHKQHQEPPSSPGAWLQTAGTPGCVADSAAQAENQRNSLWLEVWNYSHALCIADFHLVIPQQHPGVLHFFNSQVISGFTKAFLHSWLVGSTGGVWFFEEMFDFAPTHRLRTCPWVCSCAGGGGTWVQLPQEWHWVTESLASPKADQNSAINLPNKLVKFRQPNVWWIQLLRNPIGHLVSLNQSPFPLVLNKSSSFALDLI